MKELYTFIESKDIRKLLNQIDKFEEKAIKVKSRYNINELIFLETKVMNFRQMIDVLIDYEERMESNNEE